MASKTNFSKIPSISGRNGFSLKCSEIQINNGDAYCSYTVCQHTILAFKENRLPSGSFSSCASAIRAGKCKALKMMVEEIRKGESIYFVDIVYQIEAIEQQNRSSSKRSGGSTGAGFHSMIRSERKAPEQRVFSDVYGALIETAKEESAA